MMTVVELVEKLSAFPPDMPVVIAGYELGYNDVTTLGTMPIHWNSHSEWYFGRHDDPDSPDDVDATVVRIS